MRCDSGYRIRENPSFPSHFNIPNRSVQSNKNKSQTRWTNKGISWIFSMRSRLIDCWEGFVLSYRTRSSLYLIPYFPSSSPFNQSSGSRNLSHPLIIFLSLSSSLSFLSLQHTIFVSIPPLLHFNLLTPPLIHPFLLHSNLKSYIEAPEVCRTTEVLI